MPEKQETRNWRGWATGILIALLLIVALQNSQETSVDVLFASFSAPLIVILLVFAALGALIGYVAPLVWRHRRQGRKEIEP